MIPTGFPRLLKFRKALDTVVPCRLEADDMEVPMTLARCTIVLVLSLAAFAVPAQAESTSESDIGWYGWGIRGGLADDPDQGLFGFHFNLGEFTRNLRFQPDVQVGFGDDQTTVFVTAPVHYRFIVGRSFAPYAGGGVTLGWVDVDNRDSEFEAGVRAIGGLDWTKDGKGFFVELSLGFGDVHDVQILAAWSFGR
jgi:opacity protein-like surface antigen